MKFSLRPYQRDMIEAARAAFKRGSRAIILHLPTGGGKTVVAGAMIESAVARGKRVLFCADRRELIDQTSAKLDTIGVRHGVIQAGHWRDLPHLPVQVASIQTLDRRRDSIRKDYDIVVLDECHDNLSRHERILEALDHTVLVGLTATPYRTDGRPLGSMFDELVPGPTVKELVDLGALSPWRILARADHLGLGKVRIKRGDYDAESLAKLAKKTALSGDIVQKYLAHGESRRALAFCVGVDHAAALAERFREAGINAAPIHGKLPRKERDAAMADFKDGRLQIATTCDLLNKGYDDPGLSCLILARPTKSRALWRQQLGRGSRIAPGKSDCLVLDHADQTYEHGFPTDPDDIDLHAGLVVHPPIMRRCPRCRGEFPGRPAQCPYCGEVFDTAPPPERDLPEEVDAEFVEVQGETARQKAYADLADLAVSKGYKPGWASYKFKEAFHRWPTKHDMAMARHRAVPVGEREERRMVWVEQDQQGAST